MAGRGGRARWCRRRASARNRDIGSATAAGAAGRSEATGAHCLCQMQSGPRDTVDRTGTGEAAPDPVAVRKVVGETSLDRPTAQCWRQRPPRASSVGANPPFSITTALSHFRTISLANDPSSSSSRGWSILSNAADKSASRIHTRRDSGPLSVREERLDRIGTAATRSKPVGTGLEPSLPLGLQRVADPPLMTAIHHHGDTEWTLISVGLRYIHAPNRQGLPRRPRIMDPHRYVRSRLGRQGNLPIDPGRSTPRIALSHLSHTDQRVRPGTQHQFLRRPDRGLILLPRRLEDPAPQPRYVFLMNASIHDASIEDALRYVHLNGVQLALPVRPSASVFQRLTCPRQRHLRAQSPPLVFDRFPMIAAQERRHHDHKSRHLSAFAS